MTWTSGTGRQSVRKRRSIWVDCHPGNVQVKAKAGHSSPGVMNRGENLPRLLRNPLRQTEGLEKPRLYCKHAGMLAIKVKRALHWWGARVEATLSPFQIWRGKQSGSTHSKPQHGMRYEQRFGLPMQWQTGAPEVWSWRSHRSHCQHAHGTES